MARRETSGFQQEAHDAFHVLVAAAEFPCVGAKAALNAQTYEVATYDELGSDAATHELCGGLCRFAHSGSRSGGEYSTFVAVFRGPSPLDEARFEELLWEQLRKLDAAQAGRFGWDARTSPDPADPHFSFSFAGQAFYVLGLHPHSSRVARRFPWPTLVFNPHEQFEKLRADGKWQRMQETIRARDIALEGSINPMLSDFGDRSEARQYSGRAVDENWRCPFHHPEGA